nr:hypothetical protein [Tanacetum cinerariifolium]
AGVRKRPARHCGVPLPQRAWQQFAGEQVEEVAGHCEGATGA